MIMTIIRLIFFILIFNINYLCIYVRTNLLYPLPISQYVYIFCYCCSNSFYLTDILFIIIFIIIVKILLYKLLFASYNYILMTF